jgi:hypothetical protein
VRFAITFLGLAVILVGCHRHDEPKPPTEDARLQQKLIGIWSLHIDKDTGGQTYAGGQTFDSSLTVASNGAYAAELTTAGSLGVRKFKIEGTMEIKDGFLIDTMLKHSNTNFTHSSVSRARIIRFDDNELFVKYQEADFESVFRRVGK